MKFPGSKLLHHWDLPAPNLSLDDLFRSCQQAGLTGFAELKSAHSVAMIFYYLGGEVNALYREGAVAYNGLSALERMRAQTLGDEGSISVYELPLDMAHLLRGITNRQKLRETLKSANDLAEFYRKNFPEKLKQLRALPGERLTPDLSFFGVMTMPTVQYIGFANNHSVHHRGQLAAYLRAMGSKVPNIYGPSADAEPANA